MGTDYREDSARVKTSQGRDTEVRVAVITRTQLCFSLFCPRWIDAIRPTCQMGRPVTAC
jgi:hypothetical protein